MVERYDEGYAWRYTVRAAHGRNAGANLDRRGEVWRYRRRLPADLRERARKVEIVRGLGRIALAEALAEAEHLNAQVDAIFQVARSSPQADLALALAGVRKGPRSLPGPEYLYRSMQLFPEQHPQQPEPRPPSLSEAVDHYEREQWAAGRWKAEKAGYAAMAELRRFLQHTGDRPVADISREDVRAFRDHRGESLLASTLNIKVMSRLVSFFNHCREEGWVVKLPTNGLRVRDPIANRDKRRAFTLAEQHRVFGPGWKRECKGDDHKFHCGRLLLATGARAEEIAQLRIEDVRFDKGLVSIRITDDHPEQRLKNAASRRLVPLHSALVPSFRRYVRETERDGHEWVFHRWTRTPTQPRSSPIVTTFGTYLRKKCEIEDRRVVLHSLRHTVKQQLQEVGAPDSLISDLLGHAGQGETHGTYGGAATTERMSEWVERLPLSVILNPAPR
ncbi:MAG: tyrosine-type recombinase/integrase [Deltaproteobacteria bacterium]|nr:tyrosine-type recombinase/integrase [Deltaproteobacteria bacterium]MBW2384463.1 tyrosine-type recombinase/integrase [Deltaproteobacteria bacterium]